MPLKLLQMAVSLHSVVLVVHCMDQNDYGCDRVTGIAVSVFELS